MYFFNEMKLVVYSIQGNHTINKTLQLTIEWKQWNNVIALHLVEYYCLFSQSDALQRSTKHYLTQMLLAINY